MLHLFAQSPLQQATVDRVACGDDVVLIDGAVYAVRNGNCHNFILQTLLNRTCQIFVIGDMALARGISEQLTMSGIHWIGFDDLVELTVKNPVIHTWY